MRGNRKLFTQGTHRLVAHHIRALVGMMVVMMSGMSAGISAAFRDKGLAHAFHAASQVQDHVGKDRIRLNVRRILAQHGTHVSVGQVIDDAHELQGIFSAQAQQMADAAIRAALDLPVVGTVEPGAASSLAALDPYRRLRTTLSRQSAAVIQLSPVDVDVDTTTIAKNLARVSALSGHRSVVVDATGDPAEQQDVTRGDDGEPDVWHAGAWASDPDLAASAQASTLIDQLKRDYEQVVIATPPALSNPVASGLSDHADAVVLVVTPGRTKKADVGRVADDIRAVGGHLVGVLSTTDDSSVDEADGS